MPTILVVGGAGYIGSHVVKTLLENGQGVVVLDDLSMGHRDAVLGGEVFVGDLGDRALLDGIFQRHSIDCVMHFAARTVVGESVEAPLDYYDNNVGRTTRLLAAMKAHGVDKFILSSTAAVYGEPKRIPIAEDDPTAPTNPYGRSKLFIEKILADCETAHGLRYASLRYFNAAGADPSGKIGEDHSPETHLIPIVLKAALGQAEHVRIFGTDWETPDGTCLRDYVHVSDLADAHILAAERLLDGGASAIYNLGCQTGYSVKEIIDLARKITAALGWRPRLQDPETIIATAWKWHKQHPNGYCG